MLTFELESYENGRYVFIYYPNGDKTAPGRIAKYEDGKREIIHDSPADVKGYYRGHAFSGIDISKKEGTVAWC